MLIWWTSGSDVAAIGAELPSGFPAYLRSEYVSRFGRNGRGRLWAAKQFGDVSVNPWPDSPTGRLLGEHHAGIVIEDVDADFLRVFPGVITDLELTRAFR